MTPPPRSPSPLPITTPSTPPSAPMEAPRRRESLYNPSAAGSKQSEGVTNRAASMYLHKRVRLLRMEAYGMEDRRLDKKEGCGVIEHPLPPSPLGLLVVNWDEVEEPVEDRPETPSLAAPEVHVYTTMASSETVSVSDSIGLPIYHAGAQTYIQQTTPSPTPSGTVESESTSIPSTATQPPIVDNQSSTLASSITPPKPSPFPREEEIYNAEPVFQPPPPSQYYQQQHPIQQGPMIIYPPGSIPPMGMVPIQIAGMPQHQVVHGLPHGYPHPVMNGVPPPPPNGTMQTQMGVFQQAQPQLVMVPDSQYQMGMVTMQRGSSNQSQHQQPQRIMPGPPPVPPPGFQFNPQQQLIPGMPGLVPVPQSEQQSVPMFSQQPMQPMYSPNQPPHPLSQPQYQNQTQQPLSPTQSPQLQEDGGTLKRVMPVATPAYIVTSQNRDPMLPVPPQPQQPQQQQNANANEIAQAVRDAMIRRDDTVSTVTSSGGDGYLGMAGMDRRFSSATTTSSIGMGLLWPGGESGNGNGGENVVKQKTLKNQRPSVQVQVNGLSHLDDGNGGSRGSLDGNTGPKSPVRPPKALPMPPSPTQNSTITTTTTSMTIPQFSLSPQQFNPITTTTTALSVPLSNTQQQQFQSLPTTTIPQQATQSNPPIRPTIPIDPNTPPWLLPAMIRASVPDPEDDDDDEDTIEPAMKFRNGQVELPADIPPWLAPAMIRAAKDPRLGLGLVGVGDGQPLQQQQQQIQNQQQVTSSSSTPNSNQSASVMVQPPPPPQQQRQQTPLVDPDSIHHALGARNCPALQHHHQQNGFSSPVPTVEFVEVECCGRVICADCLTVWAAEKEVVVGDAGEEFLDYCWE
ncbi:hypothetical protein HDU76_005195 [Blyttiomyces sp. JEL0837]|nr:hypothetical protein HDU76_005195 [Blyttiomyces sp. JEL0837]